MNAELITDLATRLLTERAAASEAEATARQRWDAAQAIETRLREALHGNHTALLFAGRSQVAIVTDQGVEIHDLVVLGDGQAAASTAPSAAPAPAPTSPPVTRATLRDLCRDAAKTMGPEAVRGILGAKIDVIPEADLAAKVAAIRATLAQRGAA